MSKCVPYKLSKTYLEHFYQNIVKSNYQCYLSKMVANIRSFSVMQYGNQTRQTQKYVKKSEEGQGYNISLICHGDYYNLIP